jgi:hypothetical protein
VTQSGKADWGLNLSLHFLTEAEGAGTVETSAPGPVSCTCSTARTRPTGTEPEGSRARLAKESEQGFTTRPPQFGFNASFFSFRGRP